MDYSPEQRFTQQLNNSFQGDDNRYLPRWEISNRVFYQLEDNEVESKEAWTVDLSCSGACIRMDEDVPASDQKVKLRIFLSEDVFVDLSGKFVWDKTESGKKIAGVSFENTSPEAQELILNYAFELRKEDLVGHWFDGCGDSSASETEENK